MTPATRWVTGTGLATLTLLALVAASRAPWRAHPTTDGAVRISLSARPDRIESCRTLSDEELAARPAHMRQQVVCEGTTARYRLTVTLDGAVAAELLLAGGGARRDRPVHALREFPLPPGRHHLVVEWARTDSLPGDSLGAPAAGAALSRERGAREAEERERRRREAVPARLALDTIVELGTRQVILVTYDPRLRRLLALTEPRTP